MIIARTGFVNPAMNTMTMWTEEKENQEIREEEVNGARGLLTAEDVHECGDNRCDGGRHREARDDDKREQDEDYSGVSEPLEGVVGLLAKMPVAEAEENVEQAV